MIKLKLRSEPDERSGDVICLAIGFGLVYIQFLHWIVLRHYFGPEYIDVYFRVANRFFGAAQGLVVCAYFSDTTSAKMSVIRYLTLVLPLIFMILGHFYLIQHFGIQMNFFY